MQKRALKSKDNFLGEWITWGPEFCTTTNFKHKKSPSMSEIHGQNEARKPPPIANPCYSWPWY
jgi:hypothetical protein